MLQPGGHPFSADISAVFHIDNMFARTSPFLCAADSLNITTVLLTHWWRSGSVLVAAHTAWSRRFRDIPEYIKPSRTSWMQSASDHPSASTHESTILESLQNSTMARLLAFAIGTLPQVIKLFACRNLLWTQVAMAAYMSNFLLVELLAFLANLKIRGLRKTKYMDQSWYLWLDMLCFILIGMLPTTIYMSSRLSLLFGAGAAKEMNTNDKDGRSSARSLFFGLYGGIALAILPFRLATPLVRLKWFRQRVWDGAADVWGKVDVSHPAISTAVCVVHVLGLGIVTLSGYAFLFDPRGTSMPGWTNVLG